MSETKFLQISILEKEYNLIEALLYLRFDYVSSDDVSKWIEDLVTKEVNTIH